MLLPAIEDEGQNFFQPLGSKQAVFDVAGHEAVQLLHGNRAALAVGLALQALMKQV